MIFGNVNRKRNNKGNIQDIALLAVFLMTFAITTIIAFKMLNQFSGTDSARAMLGDEGTAILDENTGRLDDVLDGSFVFILTGLSMFILISAYFIDSSPIFFIVGIIFLIIMIPTTAILSNTFEALGTNNDLSSTYSIFPKMTFVMNNLPLLLGMFLVITIIVLYTKLK